MLKNKTKEKKVLLRKPYKIAATLALTSFFTWASYFGVTGKKYWNYSWPKALATPYVYYVKGLYQSIRSPFINDDEIREAILQNFEKIMEQKEDGSYWKIDGAKIKKEVGGYLVKRKNGYDFIPLKSSDKLGFSTWLGFKIRDLYYRIFDKDLKEGLEEEGEKVVQALYSPDIKDEMKIIAWDNPIAYYFSHKDSPLIGKWGKFDASPKFPYVPIIMSYKVKHGITKKNWFNRVSFDISRFFNPHELRLENDKLWKENYSKIKNNLSKELARAMPYLNKLGLNKEEVEKSFDNLVKDKVSEEIAKNYGIKFEPEIEVVKDIVSDLIAKDNKSLERIVKEPYYYYSYNGVNGRKKFWKELNSLESLIDENSLGCDMSYYMFYQAIKERAKELSKEGVLRKKDFKVDKSGVVKVENSVLILPAYRNIPSLKIGSNAAVIGYKSLVKNMDVKNVKNIRLYGIYYFSYYAYGRDTLENISRTAINNFMIDKKSILYIYMSNNVSTFNVKGKIMYETSNSNYIDNIKGEITVKHSKKNIISKSFCKINLLSSNNIVYKLRGEIKIFPSNNNLIMDSNFKNYGLYHANFTWIDTKKGIKWKLRNVNASGNNLNKDIYKLYEKFGEKKYQDKRKVIKK